MTTSWKRDDRKVDLPWKGHPGQQYVDLETGQKWELFHKATTGRALVWVPVDEWSGYVYENRLKKHPQHPAPAPRRTLPL